MPPLKIFQIDHVEVNREVELDTNVCGKGISEPLLACLPGITVVDAFSEYSGSIEA